MTSPRGAPEDGKGLLAVLGGVDVVPCASCAESTRRRFGSSSTTRICSLSGSIASVTCPQTRASTSLAPRRARTAAAVVHPAEPTTCGRRARIREGQAKEAPVCPVACGLVFSCGADEGKLSPKFSL